MRHLPSETQNLHDRHRRYPQAVSVEDFRHNLTGVRTRIASACHRAGRAPAEIRLLPSSKNKPEAPLRLAYAACWRLLGENNVQEAHRKCEAMERPGLAGIVEAYRHPDHPELEGYSTGDFDNLSKIAPLGEPAARKVAEQLARLSIPAAEYAALRQRQQVEVIPDLRPVDEIRFENLALVNPESVRVHMETKPGQPIDQKKLDMDMRRIYGTGDFEHVNYRFLDEPGKRVLAVDAVEKSWGPDSLRFGLGLSSDFGGDAFAGRFILTNLGDAPARPLAGGARNVVRAPELGLADRWIIARCDAMVREATTNYEKFRLNEAASAVYHFLWSDLADWYLEQAKPRLYGSEPGGDVARAVISRTFEVALAVLHPIMPFVTETLWGRFPGRAVKATLTRTPWPRPDAGAAAPEAEHGFGLVQELVGAIRQMM